jgi:hypothetical protein
MSLCWLAMATCAAPYRSGSVASPSPKASTATDTKAADLRTRLNLRLAENVVLTAKASAATLGGRPEEQTAYAGLLKANAADIAGLVGAGYGSDAQLRFDQLWQLRDRSISEYAAGIASGDLARRDKAMSELSGSYTLGLADLVHAWTGLVREAAMDLARTHAAMLKQLVDDQGAGRWADAYASTRKVYGQSQRLADALSQTMARRDPVLYPGDPNTRTVSFRVNLDLLLQEHGYLTAMAGAAATAGRTEEFGAAAKALNDNGSDLGAIFGPELRGRFNQIWSAHSSQLIDYMGGVITRDAARQERALTGLSDIFVSAFADLMSTAIGVPREELAGAARDQVAATRAMIDAQAGRDATAAEKDQVAARLTQPIGDSLATYAARSVS